MSFERAHSREEQRIISPYRLRNFVAKRDVYVRELMDCIRSLEYIRDRRFVVTSSSPEKTCFLVDHQDYSIRFETDNVHRQGDGGERVEYVWFDKSKNPVLLSFHFVSWDTSIDDSADYTNLSVSATYLIAEDPLARALFRAL